MRELGWRAETLSHYTEASFSSVRNLLDGKPVSLEFAVGVSKKLGLALEDISSDAALILEGARTHETHS